MMTSMGYGGKLPLPASSSNDVLVHYSKHFARIMMMHVSCLLLSLKHALRCPCADASRRSINDTVYDEDDNEEAANGARRRRQVPSTPPTNVDTLTQVQLGAL